MRRATIVSLLISLLVLNMLIMPGCGSHNEQGSQGNSEEAAIRDCINGMMSEQEKGNSGDSYWATYKAQTQFYSPTSWEILEIDTSAVYVTSYATATVRVDSSTQGGFRITKSWTFSMGHYTTGWKVIAITETL